MIAKLVLSEKSPAFETISSPTMKFQFTSGDRVIHILQKYAPINPNKPKMLPNTSTMRIFTKRSGFAASDSAAVEPVIPTDTPHNRLHIPTVTPPQNIA